jgi:vancomycin permeability regulator SanA
LYRALYIANALGLDAVGVAASEIRYGGQAIRDFREILARNKDFFVSLFKPEPTYLGDPIPLGSGGDLTND